MPELLARWRPRRRAGRRWPRARTPGRRSRAVRTAGRRRSRSRRRTSSGSRYFHFSLPGRRVEGGRAPPRRRRGGTGRPCRRRRPRRRTRPRRPASTRPAGRLAASSSSARSRRSGRRGWGRDTAASRRRASAECDVRDRSGGAGVRRPDRPPASMRRVPMDGRAERRLYYGSYASPRPRRVRRSPARGGRRGPAVITYRRFRNTDPPALVEVWNESAHRPRSVPPPHPGPLRALDLQQAVLRPRRPDRRRGRTGRRRPRQSSASALAGFGPNEELTGARPTRGVICSVARPPRRTASAASDASCSAGPRSTSRGSRGDRRGGRVACGRTTRTCSASTAAATRPGVLAERRRRRAVPASRSATSTGRAPLVFQRKLDRRWTWPTRRFGMLRRRLRDAGAAKPAVIASWWEECVWGGLEPVEFRLVDKLTNLPAARAMVWELEGFGWKWNYPVGGDHRRAGPAGPAQAGAGEAAGVPDAAVPAGPVLRRSASCRPGRTTRRSVGCASRSGSSRSTWATSTGGRATPRTHPIPVDDRFHLPNGNKSRM